MLKTKHKIERAFPDVKVELYPKDSRGDLLQNVPLHTVEGSDFFTQDIFDLLESGGADIAVHSLKDMSAGHFFGGNKFAVVERDDTRDVAIFNQHIEDKLRSGLPIVIGTCSPRREQMAMVFLKRALPQWSDNIKIETKSIRGNVDTRLMKLDSGEYDGIILATAGINRLLESPTDKEYIQQLLGDKKMMVLPLVECVPAPCQGAIVAEAHHSNILAVNILAAINDENEMNDCIAEKRQASTYGTGCLQKFGVTTIQYSEASKVLYSAGENEGGELFSVWTGIPEVHFQKEYFFNTTEYMGEFFSYTYHDSMIEIQQPHVYVSNYKAIKQDYLINLLQSKKVWASGTKTWYELAKQKIWVMGSADAFGLVFLENAWKMPLLNVSRENVCVITGDQASSNWERKGWNVVSTYNFTIKSNSLLEEKIKLAKAFFWTSFHQYDFYKSLLAEGAMHYCSSGETANLLQEAGVTPVVYPNIKSFLQCLA